MSLPRQDRKRQLAPGRFACWFINAKPADPEPSVLPTLIPTAGEPLNPAAFWLQELDQNLPDGASACYFSPALLQHQDRLTETFLDLLAVTFFRNTVVAAALDHQRLVE